MAEQDEPNQCKPVHTHTHTHTRAMFFFACAALFDIQVLNKKVHSFVVKVVGGFWGVWVVIFPYKYILLCRFIDKHTVFVCDCSNRETFAPTRAHLRNYSQSMLTLNGPTKCIASPLLRARPHAMQQACMRLFFCGRSFVRFKRLCPARSKVNEK